LVFDALMSRPETDAGAGGEPRIVRLSPVVDTRGTLIPAETGEELPFAVERYFVIRDVPAGAVRARHAQRRGHELLSCVAGACTVEARWHDGQAVHRLDDPATALHIPPRVWIECREFSADAVLLALCPHTYDPADLITDVADFEAEAGG
jgi:UDP-2-acetamido-3-amino-2,3-dideoxy-glucuronate N-acetyltransferase